MRSSISALKWNYFGFGVRAVLQIGMTAVLARLLGPDSFGLIGAALVAIGAANLIGELGYGAALIQQDIISDDDIREAFTIQMAAGIALAALVGLSAPVLASLLGDSRLESVLRWMSAVLVLQPLGVVSTSLLKRRFDFKAVQLCQVVSYVTGYLGFGVPAAVAGWGVWSLVGAQVAQAGLNSALLLAKARHPLGPKLPQRRHRLRRFSRRVILTNVVNWFIENIDNAIVAKVAGAASLGYYALAYNLVRHPTNHLVVALQGVLLPTGARIQHDPRRLRMLHAACLAAVSLVSFPAFASAWAVAGTITDALYGERWSAAAAILGPLALAMPAHAVVAVTGPVLWAINNVERELRVELIVALFLFPLLLLAAGVSPVAVAWVVACAYFGRAALLLRQLIRPLQATWAGVLLPIRGGILVALVAASLVKFIDMSLIAHHFRAPARLAVELLVGLAVLVAAPLLLKQWLVGRELHAALQQAFRGTSGRFQVLVGRALGLSAEPR